MMNSQVDFDITTGVRDIELFAQKSSLLFTLLEWNLEIFTGFSTATNWLKYR